eukprot:s3866_g3.t1
MRGPVRSRAEPYGLGSNSKAAQQEADNGTVMASRAIDMACAVKNAPRITTTERVATLENPPPSGLQEHLSAWELPEMRKFLHAEGVNTVVFNTCGYEEHLPLGSRHYKPQQFSGTLRDIAKLKRTCGCGSPSNHEAITGPVKSKASATYPDALCEEYAKLAVEQLKLIGKEEFLKSRMKSLQDTIDAAKARIIRREHPGMSERSIRKQQPRTRSPRRRLQNLPSMSPPTRREYKAATLDPRGRSPLRRKKRKIEEPAVSDRKKRRRRTRDLRVQLKPARDVQVWQGGEGKHEMLRPSSSKTKDPKLQEYLGGMRDPYKVAETFGTPSCSMNPQLVKEWKASLKKVLGARAPPALKITPRWGYQSPLDAELFEAWISKANDPDVCIPSWIRTGVPLGIEELIPVNGIFPLNSDDTGPDPLGPSELEDAAMQLSRGDMTNYSSVLDHLEDSKIELERYRKEGFMVDVDKDTVTKEMSHGTISRLGLIIKEKPEGIKRRIILDLRRSVGNRKAVLPEKLILPRPRDAVASIRSTYEQRRPHGADEGYTRELAVVDISDAFMSFAVCEKELPHTLAPNVESQDFYLFVALLFGYKTAPLLWSRLASMIGRFLQSLVQGKEGQHQIYLDDALWVLQGTLRERNSVLAMIITTLFALGLKVSLKKGLRSSQVQWVGVRFTLTEDSVILGLPEKFMAELLELLEGWDSAGMAPLKSLRQAAGKVAWLSGILPRARWTVSVFYRVLHDRLQDVASGAEQRRREQRADNRNKDGLFHVKQLEQARAWLVQFINVAKSQPTRKFRLDVGKYPKATIITDASPLGAGALLLINNRIVQAYSTKVTHRDARLLGFEDDWENSSSQGIVEMFAVLLALKKWAKELSSCHVELQIQADSVVALATTQRLSSSRPTLNFFGGETAIVCEQIGIESLRTLHIPGAANVLADYLSRPDKMAKDPLPEELKGVPVHKDDAPRGPEFYSLPPPQLAPTMWQSSAAVNDMWAGLR